MCITSGLFILKIPVRLSVFVSFPAFAALLSCLAYPRSDLGEFIVLHWARLSTICLAGWSFWLRFWSYFTQSSGSSWLLVMFWLESGCSSFSSTPSSNTLDFAYLVNMGELRLDLRSVFLNEWVDVRVFLVLREVNLLDSFVFEVGVVAHFVL